MLFTKGISESVVLKDQHLVSWDLQEAKLLSELFTRSVSADDFPTPRTLLFLDLYSFSAANALLYQDKVKSQKKSSGDPGLRVAQNLPLSSLNLPRAQLLGDKRRLKQRYWAKQGLSVWGELYSLDPCVPKFYSPKETSHREGQKKEKEKIVCNYREDPAFLPDTGSWRLSLRTVASFFGQCENYNLSLNILFKHFIRKIATHDLELCTENLDSTIAVLSLLQ